MDGECQARGAEPWPPSTAWPQTIRRWPGGPQSRQCYSRIFFQSAVGNAVIDVFDEFDVFFGTAASQRAAQNNGRQVAIFGATTRG